MKPTDEERRLMSEEEARWADELENNTHIEVRRVLAPLSPTFVDWLGRNGHRVTASFFFRSGRGEMFPAPPYPRLGNIRQVAKGKK